MMMSFNNKNVRKTLRARSGITVFLSAMVMAGMFAAVHESAQAAQEGAKTVSDGVYSADQAKRGQAAYNQACSNCHQMDLSGSDQAPSLAGGDFLDRWDAQSVFDLVERVRTTMPADSVGSLNTQSATDIVTYLLQANNFPAGQEELKPDRGGLRTVMIKKK
jgi:S-disulfanyl-L-cysteine oxidoreductase SoxD